MGGSSHARSGQVLAWISHGSPCVTTLISRITNMLHATLWTAVAGLISVLGLIIWRYAERERKGRTMYTQEALARRTIKKPLNPPPAALPSYAYKADPIPAHHHYPAQQPRLDNTWKPYTLLDTEPILRRYQGRRGDRITDYLFVTS